MTTMISLNNIAPAPASTISERILSGMLDIPLIDEECLAALAMQEDLKRGREIAAYAIAATGEAWKPALCGFNKLPVAYNPATQQVAQLSNIRGENILDIGTPWGPIALPGWQEI